MRSHGAADFLATTYEFHLICNGITSIVSPSLYSAGLSTITHVRHDSVLSNHHPVVNCWASVWSGCALIVNHTTPIHRDWGATASSYDLLVSAGTHSHCYLDLPDIGARLRYLPGTGIFISEKVLRHQVDEWLGGERICGAYFMKDAVHDRLGVARPSWPCLDDYWALIDT